MVADVAENHRRRKTGHGGLKTTVVVTGQQIGLLGGGLLCAYKVLGAARMAQKTGGRAVYWLEGNDADFAEIASVHYVAKSKTLKTLRWKKDSKGQRIGDLLVDKALLNLQKTFFEDVVQTPRTSYLRKLFSETFVEGTTLMQACKSLAERLFGGFGVECFDSTDADFLSRSRPILLAEANRTPIGQQAEVFALVEGKREAVFRTEKGFANRRGEALDLGSAALLPNVKTRSLVQNAFFGTSHYVAGPSEEKYLKGLGAFYRFHKVAEATTLPRASITLLDAKTASALERLGLGRGDVVSATKEELLRQYLLKNEGWTTSGLKQSSKALTTTYVKGLAAMGFEVRDLERMLYLQLKERVGSMRKLAKQKHRAELDEIARVSDRLFPYGKPQERMFCVAQAMNTYGLDLMDVLRHHCEVGRGHRFVVL